MTSHAITDCLSSSSNPHIFSEAFFFPRVHLTHFALSSLERVLRLPTFYPISVLAKVRVKPRFSMSWRVLAPTHPSRFLLFDPGRFSLLALFTSLESTFLRYGAYSFYCMFRLDPPLFRQGATLSHLDSSPSHDLVIWTDSSFPFASGGSYVIANCSHCGVETTLFYLRGSVVSCCSLLHFASSPVVLAARTNLPLLSDSRCVLAALSSPSSFFLSLYLTHLAEIVVSLLFYQAKMGPRSLIFPSSNTVDELARQGALIQRPTFPCGLSPFGQKANCLI